MTNHKHSHTKHSTFFGIAEKQPKIEMRFVTFHFRREEGGAKWREPNASGAHRTDLNNEQPFRMGHIRSDRCRFAE